MIDKELVKATLERELEGMGLFLIDLNITRENIITVEIDAYDRPVSIDDCVVLQHAVAQDFDRDIEDYQLEVGSAGITSPFKVLPQYKKNVGNSVEVLTADGKKLKGVLAAADEDGFSLTIDKKVNPEGAKRPVMVQETLTFGYADVQYTKYLIDFK